MPIREVTSGKKRYLDLLLLADEREDMIDRYLERGAMFLLEFDSEAVGECVVTDEGDRLLEFRNLAVAPAWQGRGLGRALVAHVERRFAATHDVLQVGTGDVPSTVGFYERCGFVRSHRVRDFFTRHYDHPIVEDGVLLTDMVYLRKAVGPRSRAELLDADRARDIATRGRPLCPSRRRGDRAAAQLEAAGAHEPTPTPYFVLERLMPRLGLEASSRLLDVGCGAGRVLAYCVEARLACRVTGVELDDDLARTAAAWSRGLRGVEVVAGSALDMPLGDFTHFYLFNPFDNAVLVAFLEALERQATHAVTLAHMSDNGESYTYWGRPGWTLLEEGAFREYPAESGSETARFQVFGCDQHYSIWRFDPLAARAGR